VAVIRLNLTNPLSFHPAAKQNLMGTPHNTGSSSPVSCHSKYDVRQLLSLTRAVWLAVDLLSQYFGAKLTEFSQASASGKSDSSDEGEEESDAMDVSRSPRPAVTVMGEAWVQRLRQILMYVQQLGLEVSSSDI